MLRTLNQFLRTAPPRRLLSAILGLVATAALGTTIAIAARGSGPVPPQSSLARAIHRGLRAPVPNGLSARITFTDNLIASSEVQGSDPLLTGGSGRLWITGHRLRLEIQGSNGDAQVVVNRGAFWVYDPAFRTAYEGTLPSGQARATGASRSGDAMPTVTSIQNALKRLAKHLRLSGAIPGDLAGQPAYSVRISPRHDNGLLGAVELTWDAIHRVPLQVALYARGDATPVLELSVTDISLGRQAPSVFSISPPSGSKVVKIATVQSHTTERADRRHRASAVSGLSAVAQRVPFALRAPARLAGRSRSGVRLLELSGHPVAAITYGQGVGTIVVLEQPASAVHRLPSASGGDGAGLTLPTLSIHGATAQQIQTAIGTLVRFTRARVTYTVLGSVTASTADAAARAL